jgi:hypothetical protein
MWGSMEAYVACSGAPIGGAPYALYITDPTTQPDTSLWQTDIVYPIMPPMAKHSEGEGHDHEHGDADHGDSEEHDHEEGDGNEADTE